MDAGVLVLKVHPHGYRAHLTVAFVGFVAVVVEFTRARAQEFQLTATQGIVNHVGGVGECPVVVPLLCLLVKGNRYLPGDGFLVNCGGRSQV